jgi:hypothetical protein
MSAQGQDEEFVSMYDVLEALEQVVKAADPAKRAVLAKAMDGFHDWFPEEFHWASGPQAPALLYHLMMSIDCSCRPEAQSKPRPPMRLVDRKPEGNA